MPLKRGVDAVVDRAGKRVTAWERMLLSPQNWVGSRSDLKVVPRGGYKYRANLTSQWGYDIDLSGEPALGRRLEQAMVRYAPWPRPRNVRRLASQDFFSRGKGPPHGSFVAVPLLCRVSGSLANPS